MYRPTFRALTHEALITFRKAPALESPSTVDVEVAHIEALYSATETELVATRTAEQKMKAYEEALREVRRLIQLLKDECPLDEQKSMMLELIREKKHEAVSLEGEVDLAQRVLKQATHQTNSLSSKTLVIQLNHEEEFIH